jgi:hypothetical protein
MEPNGNCGGKKICGQRMEGSRINRDRESTHVIGKEWAEKSQCQIKGSREKMFVKNVLPFLENVRRLIVGSFK